MSMKAGAEAVIIGGGIQGASAAYHLARRGFTDVYLIDWIFLSVLVVFLVFLWR